MVAMTTCGMADEVFHAYGDMTKRREAPDVNTFTVLLAACSRDEERGLDKVEHIWREMVALHVKPDLVCYHTLLRCLRVAGIPEEMKERGETKILLPAIKSRELVSLVSQQPSENLESFREIPPRANVSNRDTKFVKSGKRTNTECEPFELVSNSRVHICLFGSGVSPLTLRMTDSGWRWLDPESVSQVLSVMSEAGLTPDRITLDHLSKMAADWTSVVRGVVGGENTERGVVNTDGGVVNTEVGVAPNTVFPDGRCLLSAIHVQVALGNRKAVEVGY